MKRVVRLVLWLPAMLAVPAFAADAVNGKTILEQSREALRAVETVRYLGRFEVEGPLASQLSRMEGRVLIREQEDKQQRIPLLRIDAQVTPAGRNAANRIELVHDGEAITLLDHTRKKFRVEKMPGGVSMLSGIAMLVLSEFFTEDALTDEIQARAIEVAGREKIGDSDCHVLKLSFGDEDDRGPATLWIGVSDQLPRKVTRTYRDPDDKLSTLTLTLTELNPRPEISDTTFRLEQPEGFEEDLAASDPRMLAPETEAPDWTLRTPDGKEVALSSLRGKVVLLDFWATWCGPCKLAMPGLQKLHERYKDQPVQIIGISCREPKGAQPEKYMEEKKYTYMLLVDGTKVAEQYRVTGIPAFYLIGRDGRVLWAQAGFSPDHEEKLQKMIDRELKAAAGEKQMEALERSAEKHAAPEKGT